MLMAYDDTTPTIARVKALSDLEAGEGANDPPAESNDPVLDLEFKRVKQQWNEARQKYDDRIELEETVTSASDAGYAFSLVRMLRPNTHIPYVQIHVRSRDFITAAQDVMAGKRNVVWQTIPVKFEALELLAFLPQFVKDLEKRQSKPIEEGPNIEEHNRVIYHLEYFVNFLQREYSSHVETFNSLRASTYIIFDSLWALLLPGMTLMTKCQVTGVPRLVRLITMSKRQARWDSPEQWALLVEYVDMVSGRVGLIEEELIQEKFSGAKLIVELVAYPFEEPLGAEKPLVEDYKEVRATLVERGRKRSKLEEESYMWYDGDGFYKDGDTYRKRPVRSRIVIDRDMYDQHSGHSTPNLTHDLDHEKICPESRTTLTDDEYALMAPRVHGFALEKKQWYQFSVNDIYEINWDLELFGDLNLDEEYKTMLKVMVGACYPEMEDTEGIISSARFDDFLWGKGKGFICNLHGPPGVGKTLTVEALSEVTKNVLYVVGCGDLGIDAGNIEKELSTIFKLAVRWRAIVLIHAADVYLESPDIRDTERNAVESVFMRKLEYYPGVVFLTTNRDTVFEGGIRSRIDLSLFYYQPTVEARERLWAMFLKRTDMSKEERQIFNERYMATARELCLNGREIKSIVKVAKTSAKHLHREVQARDIMSVIHFLQTQGQIGDGFVAEPKVDAPVTAPNWKLFAHAACGAAFGLAVSLLAL